MKAARPASSTKPRPKLRTRADTASYRCGSNEAPRIAEKSSGAMRSHAADGEGSDSGVATRGDGLVDAGSRGRGAILAGGNSRACAAMSRRNAPLSVSFRSPETTWTARAGSESESRASPGPGSGASCVGCWRNAASIPRTSSEPNRPAQRPGIRSVIVRVAFTGSAPGGTATRVTVG